jgi:hypothetical protein
LIFHVVSRHPNALASKIPSGALVCNLHAPYPTDSQSSSSLDVAVAVKKPANCSNAALNIANMLGQRGLGSFEISLAATGLPVFKELMASLAHAQPVQLQTEQNFFFSGC